jgi:UDP-N-acetylmuramate: L-alanyl-gamma-D-glutamyl-meso-diaminopimelate ligase
LPNWLGISHNPKKKQALNLDFKRPIRAGGKEAGRAVDMALNRIPDNVRAIHLIAACGSAMGALAAMLTELGYRVSGSDHRVYPPMSTFLAEKGIGISDGFRASNLIPRPDLVVVGNTVTQDNPEAEAVNAQQLFFCSLPQALNHFVGTGKQQLVVTGTHGKTTTASLLAWVLEVAGRAPSFVIGGIVRDFGSNYRLGAGPDLVLEGDEYDTAFFDKGSKFLHFRPHVAVLTSVEFDHADIFRDVAHVREAFGAFVSGLGPECTLIAAAGHPEVDRVLDGHDGRIIRYGAHTAAQWRLGAVSVDPPWTRFTVLQGGRLHGRFQTRLVGEHNLCNALAVIAVADVLGIGPAAVGPALESFQGAKRRQEVRGRVRGVTVIDDFAHHPTAVRETIRAFRPHCTHGRLIAVFEPRTNSSMRRVFQSVYPLAFDDADLVCVREPSMLAKIPAGERFSSGQLVADLKQRGKNAILFTDTDGIVAFLTREARSGDIVLIMSNGGFDDIHERLLAALTPPQPGKEPQRCDGSSF